MKMVTRYHPLLVSLHWLLFALILLSLGVGFFVLRNMPNSDPQKIGILLVHMSAGMAILALMAVRLAVRLWTSHPPQASIGVRLADRLAKPVHYGFYVLVLMMAATGLATALLAGLNEIVFQGSGEPLPADLGVYPTRVAHGYAASIFVVLIGMHAAAALYHQFVRKDGLAGRMWFGR